ncbi:uncharacterized protein DUF4232 [Streptomyces sp. BK022]|uniref:DUF4232 domain-containing protein n=1 Tax=Streptomyces sp. BK022 TaxID=2512123 RepID=UPI001028BB29|nr:DUF4232 domain-containing protein [Streptomyces sp. BK022]RZU30134.1 uncharacterized protein DUF4232 [Streptomyces sp. BK022]
MRSTTRTTTAASLTALAALALVGVQAGAAHAATSATSATCTTANTKLTVTEVSRPVNHLLLKATNTGTATCDAYYAPLLRAGADAQAPLAWFEDSKPQAVVTLKPGESAYAGIATYSPDGEGGATEKTLGVFFTDRNAGGTGKEKTLNLPNGGVFFNSAAAVTYWQDNAADALTW